VEQGYSHVEVRSETSQLFFRLRRPYRGSNINRSLQREALLNRRGCQTVDLSEKTIRRMFEREPGVLCWGKSETRFRRGYRTLRIPETVMLRVHRQLRIAS
jgi:TPP-dependent 2-oxoacid decarboxylase